MEYDIQRQRTARQWLIIIFMQYFAIGLINKVDVRGGINDDVDIKVEILTISNKNSST